MAARQTGVLRLLRHSNESETPLSSVKRGFIVVLLLSAAACTGSGAPTPPSPVPSPTATTFSLSGQITDSTSGAGIAGATVSIADSVNAGKLTTTDGSGNYSFAGLQQAGFTVNVSSSGYIASARGVTLTSNQTLSFQLVRMPIVFVVNGTVTDGASGGALPNVLIQVADGPNAGKSAATDVAGNYNIGGVAPGTFSLSAAAAAYETAIKTVTVSANTRVDFVLQPSCTFTVRPQTLSYTRGGFPVTGGTAYRLDISASAPMCAWTASDDANDWLFLQVQGSGASYSHSISGTGSAVVFAAANAYGGATGTRTTAVRVRWTVGGVDIVACQPDC